MNYDRLVCLPLKSNLMRLVRLLWVAPQKEQLLLSSYTMEACKPNSWKYVSVRGEPIIKY